MEERERKDQEKAEYIRARQERLGHISVPTEEKAEPKAETKAETKTKATKAGTKSS